MINITVVSYNNEVLPSPKSASFDRDGKTFGRSKDNHFILEDPRNLVSRTQAMVKSDGVRHSIVNLSKANPMVVNGKEIAPEREYDLKVGDQIQVGLYVLRADPPSADAGNTTERAGLSPTGSGNPALTASSAASPISAAAHTGAGASAVAGTGGSPVGDVARAMPQAPDAASVASGQDADAQVLMQAFLKGAGISSVMPSQGLTPEFMELVGRLLAIAVQGTIGLSAQRALVKREVNADITMVVMRNNNPLKFFPDSETVLMQMFRKKMPGFMGPVEAMIDAYEDLQAHQLGVVAGMRAAIGDMLGHLNPEALEKGVKAGSFLDSVLPAARKARLWDAYAELFQKVNLKAQDDFELLFGRAFLQAYEAEIERAKSSDQDA